MTTCSASPCRPGTRLSALVYVDHNLGTVVKDAFVVPEPLEDLALKVGTTIDDPDQSLDPNGPRHCPGGDRGGDRARRRGCTRR